MPALRQNRSLSTVLLRVANAVEPFGFEFMQQCPLLSLFDGRRDALGQRPDLFDQLNHGPADEIEEVHGCFRVIKRAWV